MHNVFINKINRCAPIDVLLEKRCIKFVWNLFYSNYVLYKKNVKISYTNINSTIAKNIFFLCINITLHIAWQKTIKRSWRIDKRPHNGLTNVISGCLPINLMLEKRCLYIELFQQFNINYIKLQI